MVRLRLEGADLDEARLRALLHGVAIERVERQRRPVVTRSLDPEILVALLAGGFSVLSSVLGPLLTEIYKARRERLEKALKPVQPLQITVQIIREARVVNSTTVELHDAADGTACLEAARERLGATALLEDAEVEISIERDF